MLAHIRFNTSMVLIFSDLNNTQIYEMPYRDSPQHEIEILMSFNFFKLFKPNDESFIFEIEYEKYSYVGGKLVTFGTNDTTKNCSSDRGFNDIKYPFAYNEKNIYLMLHQKYILILFKNIKKNFNRKKRV